MTKSIASKIRPEISESRRRMNQLDETVETLYCAYVRDVVDLRGRLFRLSCLLAGFALASGVAVCALLWTLGRGV